ncbi:hypothetical protein [Parasutterella sp.]|uniref:hypothetical protein n=2 Tax=Parasutterella sp. TaxID=2049037 RepID=UPI00351FF85D
MENRRKYIYWALMGPTLTAAALALSSGGMYFIENLSIQFFGDEPTPAVNLWVIAFSTVILAAFMIFSAWWSEKEDSTSKEIKVTVEDWQKQTPLAEPWIPGKEANEIVLDNVGEVPLDEMEDGERILYKCFRYEGGEKHVFYRVLVKVTDEEDGPVLKDENDTDMEWIQEDTKCFGAWGFFDVRDITNYDDGSKYKEVPY